MAKRDLNLSPNEDHPSKEILTELKANVTADN